MRVRKKFTKPIDVQSDSAHVVGAVNAVVNANVNEPGKSVSSSRQTVRIKTRNGESVVEVTDDSQNSDA